MPEEQELIEGVCETIEEQLESVEESTDLTVALRVTTMATIIDSLDAMETSVGKEIDEAIAKVDPSDTAKAKKVISSVNATLEDISKRRIAVKNEVLKPYMVVEERIKLFNERMLAKVSSLRVVITKAEEKWIADRKDLIHDLKAERFGKEAELVEAFIRKCDWIDNQSWMNKGYTAVKIAKELDDKVLAINADLTALDILNDGNPHAAPVAMNYQQFGKLSQAIALRKQLEEAEKARVERIEAQKRADEERKAREAEQKRIADEERAKRAEVKVSLGHVKTPDFMTNAIPVVEKVVVPTTKPEAPKPEDDFQLESTPEPVEVPKIIIFKAELTTAQAVKLISFLKSEGVRYGIVKE